MAERAIITRVSQERETPAQLVHRRSFSYRYAYARSADNRASGEHGQDYLVLREDDWRLAFALCDGVSQSFFGDLAARLVAEALVEWLWERKLPTDDARAFQAALSEALQGLTPVAREHVRAVSLPEHLPPLVRDVLEHKRAAVGSQTTYVGGLLDASSDSLLLTWMGDSRIRFWDWKGTERTGELGDSFHAHERWSSQQGVLGEVHATVMTLRGVSRFMVYSDGLATVAGHLDSTVGNRVLEDLIAQLAGFSVSDDVSLLEMWPGTSPAAQGLAASAQAVQVTTSAPRATVPSSDTQPDWPKVPAGGGLPPRNLPAQAVVPRSSYGCCRPSCSVDWSV
jgi:hypothetical protein